MNLSKAIRVYAITHKAFMEDNFIDAVKRSIDGGITMLQIREKDLPISELKKQVESVKGICTEYHIPLIVNDSVEVLEQTNIDGIHIGQDDEILENVRKRFKDKIIGVSVSTLEEAIEAEKKGADYLGVGAVFTTNTKDNPTTVTFDLLKQICDTVNIPVCAIGGVTAKNIPQLKNTNIDGVSVISEIYNKPDVKAGAKAIRKAIDAVLVKKVLTIAGSDCSGGAGIQADLKTMTAHKKYGMSVVTAITAQNTQSVDYIEEISVTCIEKQLESIFNDIVPDSVKIGMVSNIEIIKIIGDSLKKFNAKNIVLDPVMVSTSGCKLINDDAIEALKTYLFSIADLITPNIPEAEILSGMTIKDEEDMIKASKLIGEKYKVNVLIKGGHLVNDATDILYNNGDIEKFVEEFVECSNTHGTGCTLSSAIACNLADKYSMGDSIKLAKKYLVNALKNDMDLGKCSGPLNHMYNVNGDIS